MSELQKKAVRLLFAIKKTERLTQEGKLEEAYGTIWKAYTLGNRMCCEMSRKVEEISIALNKEPAKTEAK